MVTKGDRRGRDKLGVWNKHIHTAIHKARKKGTDVLQDNNKSSSLYFDKKWQSGVK